MHFLIDRGRHDDTLPSWVNSLANSQEEEAESSQPETKMISMTGRNDSRAKVARVVNPPATNVIPVPEQKYNSCKVARVEKSSSTALRSTQLKCREPESFDVEEMREKVLML